MTGARFGLFSLAVVVSTLLTGCVRYAPRPVDTTAMATARAAFDPVAVQAEAARLDPARARGPLRWDQLTLFAAALLYNPDIAAARAGLASADAGAKAARTGAGPNLTLSSEYAGAATEASPWLFGTLLDIPLDIGGRRRTRLDQAALAATVVRYDYAEAVWMVRMALRRTLAARLVADRQTGVLNAALALRQRHFAAMERRVNAGEAVRADLELVRANLADTARRLREAQAQSAANTAALAALIGVAPGALTDIQIAWADFDVPAQSISLTDTIRTQALVSRADILKAVAAYDGSEGDLRGEIAKQYPAITISPGFTWERGLVKLPFNIGLALPPRDLNRRAIAAAEARRAESGKRLEASVANAGAAIDAAMREASAARQSLAAVRSGELGSARRLAKIADTQINAGAIDRTDWASAQSGLAIAQLSVIDALARVHAADAAVEDAARRPLLGPELAIIRKTAQP
jgi:outer membrane protein TolC